MENFQLKYYSDLANWDFSHIKYEEEILTNWNYFEEIKKHTNEHSLCLDLGTAGGEEVLNNYPDVGMVIATDFSPAMIATAKKNLEDQPEKNVKFTIMDNLDMHLPDNLFDLVSARHTVIDAKAIYNCLAPGGFLVIEGVDQKDCWDLKELFGKGQAFFDEIAISEKDYQDLVNAGFSKVEKVELLINEYYKTPEDLMALLLKAPILDDFSEIGGLSQNHLELIDKTLFDKYVKTHQTEKGIFLKRVLYGIVAQK